MRFEEEAMTLNVAMLDLVGPALAEIPAGRFGNADEIGNLAVFLSSPLAGYVTGTVIPVDGGMSRFAF